MKRYILLTLLCIMALMACNSNKSNDNASNDTGMDQIKTSANMLTNQKLFEGLELPVYVEKLKANEGKNLIVPTGAEIKVPSNAFVDKDGNELKGDISIKYKEIKSPADMIIENVDMTYDSAGHTFQFVTAGMFDLRAFSGNDELKLKAGKSIEVSYVSNKVGNFNVYHYNNGWKYAGVPIGNSSPNTNVNMEPQGVGLLVPTAVDADKDLIVDIQSAHKKLPEFAIYKNVLWKYTGSLSNSELSEMLGTAVSETSLSHSSKRGEYIYKFSTKKGKFEIPVKPVFSPKALKEATKNYEALIAKQSKETKIKRTVDVTQLGLMNYDAIYHRSDAVVALIDFKIKNNDKINVQDLPLFHITGDDNVLVNISGSKQITYSKSLNNKIVAVLPGRKVAVLGTTDFLKATKSKAQGQKLVLELNEMDATIESPSDLNQIISEL
jgi:hypothetical protein